ncbi:FAD/NAD(P)-binding domain-containing protein [Mycena chlorophos]|uniref:FAD/NAD(P)-binding domain-containing protein n=1 Tax=Mycena chlorophos TaxID=658473 RepID=A0A8H6S065_MYCCL|nr:FAD/NAD(P)-binding domain-containing protein [Mycena chlorophos]
MESDRTGTPLKVTIVGAGIGGLAAAIALRHAGHVVQIFESSQNKTEVGAGIALQANALRVLNAFGMRRENLKGATFAGFNIRDAVTGQGVSTVWTDFAQAATDELNPLTCHRSDIHDELKRLATSSSDSESEFQDQGPPAELHLGSKVVACDPAAGSITLANGEVITADLVIGADGVRSTIRTSILGGTPVVPLSKWSCYRCLLDASNLVAYPQLSWLTDADAVDGPWNIDTKGDFAIFFVYFLRGTKALNFVALHYDPEQEGKPYIQPATKADILTAFSHVHDKFKALLDLPTLPQGTTTPAPPPIQVWRLLAVPLLPTWTTARALIMGDAAHGTLLTLGQGAAMAIEEAATLGCLLPWGTAAADVPRRLQAFEELRKARGEFVNRHSVEQGMPETRNFLANQQGIREYIIDHDALKTAQKYYNAHFAA